jgi:hypothetical protein
MTEAGLEELPAMFPLPPGRKRAVTSRRTTTAKTSIKARSNDGLIRALFAIR